VFKIAETDRHAAVQEGQLAQTIGENVPLESVAGEDRVIREEGDLGAGAVGVADDLELRHGMSALEALPVDFAVAADLDLHPLAQRVDAGDADAVQAAGHLVVRAVELAARV